MMHRAIQILAFIVIVACRAGHAQDPETESDPWAPLNLIDVPCDQCRLRVDPVFRDHLDDIQPWVSRELAAHRERQARGNDIAENAPEILARINEILGFAPSELQLEKQRSTLHGMTRFTALPIAPADEFTLIITHPDTGKNYLRTGGSLPGHSYDPERDVASYHIAFEGKINEIVKDDSTLQLPELVIPSLSIDEFDPATQSILPGDGLSFVVLHEVIEFTIYEMIDFADRNGRWFGDGFSNALTMVMLRERGMNDAADQLAQSLDVAEYADIPKTDLILRFWPNIQYEISAADAVGLMTEYETDLRLARYAWSYHECNRIIDDHGIEIVAMIMHAAAEQEQLKSQYLPGITSTVTGDDISARLNAYQDFGSHRQGRDAFDLAAILAAQAGDFERAFSAISRAMEIAIRDHQYPHEFMASAAVILCEMGRVEDSAAYIRKLISRAEENTPELADFWRSRALIQAIHFGRPDLAYSSIDSLLARDDVPPLARAAQAHRLLHVDGNRAEARRMAEQLLSDESIGWTDQQRSFLEAIVTEAGDDDSTDG